MVQKRIEHNTITALANELSVTEAMKQCLKESKGVPWKFRKDGYALLIFKREWNEDWAKDKQETFWQVYISVPQTLGIDVESPYMVTTVSEDGSVIGWDYRFHDQVITGARIMRDIEYTIDQLETLRRKHGLKNC